MTELREVFEMVTKQAEPDRDAWNAQEQRQRRAARNRKMDVFGLVAAILAALVVIAFVNVGAKDEDPTPAHTGSTAPSGEGPLGMAVVGLDGAVVQDLGLPTDAWMPDLSADGTRVMFLTRSYDVGFCGGCVHRVDRIAVLRVGASSGKFVYLVHAGHIAEIEEPVWSPDGTQIAFVGVSKQDGNRDVYVATMGSGNNAIITGTAVRLTDDPAVDEFPAWSPDGSTIFYDNGGAEPLGDSGFSSTQEIWSVPADGGNPQRLTNNKVPDAQADVATDGTVAFWRDGSIWTMNSDGGNAVRLETVAPDTGFNPRWSPDGSMIAMLRYDTLDRATYGVDSGRPTSLPLLQVVVVDLATGEVTTVGPRVASDFNPVSWLPDGSALLINRYDAGA